MAPQTIIRLINNYGHIIGLGPPAGGRTDMKCLRRYSSEQQIQGSVSEARVTFWINWKDYTPSKGDRLYDGDQVFVIDDTPQVIYYKSTPVIWRLRVVGN